MLYTEEIPKPGIVYVEDNPDNFTTLTKKLGPIKALIDREKTYLEINLNNKTWRKCFSFEWLYRNQPKLSDIKDLEL